VKKASVAIMSFADAKGKAFDRWATSMDNQPWFQDIMLQITTALRCRLAFIGIENPVSAGTKLLDYASGTGLVSSALLNHFTTIRGIDISPQIVRVYNSRFFACGIPASRIHSVVGNLVSEDREPCPRFDGDSGEWTDFDTVIAGFSFRHFDNAGLAAEKLVERLRPDGVLCVFDLLEQDRRMSNDRQKTKPLHDLDVIRVH